MAMTKKTSALILIISIFACIFSLYIYFISSSALSIQQIPLKKDLFDSSKTFYEFSINNLDNKTYNVELRLHKKEGIFVFDVIDGEIKSKLLYEITAELTDSEGIVIARKDINRDSRIPMGFSKDEIDMKILRFDAKRDERYNLITTFKSPDGYFDTFQTRVNELVVVEDYDYAAMPVIGLFKLLSKAGILITLAVCAWMIYLIAKKNKQSQP
jgi:hypothetical protein